MDLDSTDLKNIRKECAICLKHVEHTYREHRAAIRQDYMREYMRDFNKDKVAYVRGNYKMQRDYSQEKCEIKNESV